MVATPPPPNVRYRKLSPPGAGSYEVLYEEGSIGTVARFRLSAGQFGSRWIATTPAGGKSNRHMTRDAAARWLIEQARATSGP